MEILQIELVQGEPSTLKLHGEVDLSTVDRLRAALEEALASDPRLVIDMSGVTFFDATGLRVLLQVAATRNGAGPLPLVGAHKALNLLELVGLTDLPSIVIHDPGDVDDR